MDDKSIVKLKRFLHYGSDELKYAAVKYDIKFKHEFLSELLPKPNQLFVDIILKNIEDGCSVSAAPILFALAYCVKEGSSTVKHEAYKASRSVFKSDKDLFLFNYYLKQLGIKGFGRGRKKAVVNWYNLNDQYQLAESFLSNSGYLGWNHKRIITNARVKFDDEEKKFLRAFLVKGTDYAIKEYESNEKLKPLINYITKAEHMKKSTDKNKLTSAIKDFGFPVDKFFHRNEIKSADVWFAIIFAMNTEKLIGQLSNYIKKGILIKEQIKELVITKLDMFAVDKDVNPASIFIAAKKYEYNRIWRARKKLSYPIQPDGSIYNSLMSIVMKAIKTLPATGLKYLVCIDGRKTFRSKYCFGEKTVRAYEAQSLITLCIVNAESECNVNVITNAKLEDSSNGNPIFKRVNIKKDDAHSIEYVSNAVSAVASADDKEPMNLSHLLQWATNYETGYDVIIILCDISIIYEQNTKEYLENYRKNHNRNTRFILCTLNGIPPMDTNITNDDVLLICGFNKNVIRLIEAYSKQYFD